MKPRTCLFIFVSVLCMPGVVLAHDVNVEVFEMAGAKQRCVGLLHYRVSRSAGYGRLCIVTEFGLFPIKQMDTC